MHRQYALGLLECHVPLTHQEEVFKEMAQEFIQQHPRCFERANVLGHVTASALLLNKDYSKTLLTHHKKLNRWFQLGGHSDGIADPLVVALKEAQEESGIQNIKPVSKSLFDIDIHLIPARDKEAAHYHYDFRFLLYTEEDESSIVISPESHNLKWIYDHELPENSSQGLKRLFHKWQHIKMNRTHHE